MSKACVFFADGLEECEALIVVDVLRRAGVEVTTASISGSRAVRSTHGVSRFAWWRWAAGIAPTS